MSTQWKGVSMRKMDIVRAVAEDLDINQAEAKVLVQKILDTLREALATEGRLELRNFGVFQVRRRAARNGRNPRTGEKVDVPEKDAVTFKPGKVMQSRIESGGR